MNRRGLLCATAGLGSLSGCTSVSERIGIGSTETEVKGPCQPPTSEPADAVRISDNSLSLREIRRETDAYPDHEAGAVGIYEDRSGNQLVVGAYRFGSESAAQSAADQGLNPEGGVIAQLNIDNWLLLSHAPEQEQARSLILSTGVSEDCLSDLAFYGILTYDGFMLGSTDQPWEGAMITVKGGSPSDLRESMDIHIPVILTGETVHTAYVATQEYEAFEQLEDTTDFELLAVLLTSVEGLPVCAIGSRVQLPAQLSESEILDVFPDPIRIEKVSSIGRTIWEVLSQTDSESELSSRISELQVPEEEVSVQTYIGCDVQE